MSIRETLEQRLPSWLKFPVKHGIRAYRRISSWMPARWRKHSRTMGVDDYEEWYWNRPQAQKHLNNTRVWTDLADMIEHFKPHKTFEFGSGLGYLLEECQKRNIDIVGSETSIYAIEHSICGDKVLKIGRIPEHRLPFDDNSFDLVVSSDVMEHVDLKDTEPVIKELNRICSRHALFTINTTDPAQPGHINMHSRRWWLKKFEANGFKHDEGLCRELEKMTCLRWNIYVFSKSNGQTASADH